MTVEENGTHSARSKIAGTKFRTSIVLKVRPNDRIDIYIVKSNKLSRNPFSKVTEINIPKFDGIGKPYRVKRYLRSNFSISRRNIRSSHMVPPLSQIKDNEKALLEGVLPGMLDQLSPKKANHVIGALLQTGLLNRQAALSPPDR